MSDSTGHRQAVDLQTRDGTSLKGTEYRPVSQPHSALLVNSGAGIPQHFYARLVNDAAEHGLLVLTYDYRGIGDSAPRSLKGCQATYRDCGQQDVPTAIDWIRREWGELPLTVIGHSTGGQQLGPAAHHTEIQAAVFVAVSTGYWRGMPWHCQWMSLLLWKLYMPLASRVYGDAPSQKIRWGENLPAGVARECGVWCQKPSCLTAFF